jgi:membrane-associated phospholipid phosphatase
MDWLLIKIDYWIFGVHPTVWMEKYVNLWLSDYLHFAYTSYYMIPPTIAGILYFRGQYLEFRELVVAGVLGAYLGYIGYVSVPAIGPRYTQSHLYTIGVEGKYITHVIRYTLDMLEPTKRDCFPSLHTALTAIPTWYAFKYLRKIFYFLVPISISLLIATIYGRYHYVIDVIAGLLLAWLCVWFSPKINRWWYQHITTKPLQDYFPKSIEKTPLFVTIHQLIKPKTKEGNQ